MARGQQPFRVGPEVQVQVTGSLVADRIQVPPLEPLDSRLHFLQLQVASGTGPWYRQLSLCTGRF